MPGFRAHWQVMQAGGRQAPPPVQAGSSRAGTAAGAAAPISAARPGERSQNPIPSNPPVVMVGEAPPGSAPSRKASCPTRSPTELPAVMGCRPAGGGTTDSTMSSREGSLATTVAASWCRLPSAAVRATSICGGGRRCRVNAWLGRWSRGQSQLGIGQGPQQGLLLLLLLPAATAHLRPGCLPQCPRDRRIGGDDMPKRIPHHAAAQLLLDGGCCPHGRQHRDGGHAA